MVRITKALKQFIEPFTKLGEAITNSVVSDSFIEVAKIMFISVVLGLMAAVAVITFTLIMTAIL